MVVYFARALLGISCLSGQLQHLVSRQAVDVAFLSDFHSAASVQVANMQETLHSCRVVVGRATRV